MSRENILFMWCPILCFVHWVFKFRILYTDFQVLVILVLFLTSYLKSSQFFMTGRYFLFHVDSFPKIVSPISFRNPNSSSRKPTVGHHSSSLFRWFESHNWSDILVSTFLRVHLELYDANLHINCILFLCITEFIVVTEQNYKTSCVWRICQRWITVIVHKLS